jgi:SAM-dependent methyltransferase
VIRAPSPCRRLAEYYDQLFNSFTPFTAAARQSILGPILPRVRSACDLACGTGATALLLAGQGIHMYAVDLSPAMCGIVRRKAHDAHLVLRVIRADIRRFRLPELVDLVLCEFDALNHVPRKSDLALVAGSVGRALRPGGWFYFDVNNRLSFEKLWPLTWFHDRPDFALVIHGGYDRRRDKAWSDIDWFFREGKRWRRERERIEEVCREPGEIRDTLRAAGFDSIRAIDAEPFFTGDPLMCRGIRTIYLARKSRQAQTQRAGAPAARRV